MNPEQIAAAIQNASQLHPAVQGLLALVALVLVVDKVWYHRNRIRTNGSSPEAVLAKAANHLSKKLDDDARSAVDVQHKLDMMEQSTTSQHDRITDQLDHSKETIDRIDQTCSTILLQQPKEG